MGVKWFFGLFPVSIAPLHGLHASHSAAHKLTLAEPRKASFTPPTVSKGCGLPEFQYSQHVPTFWLLLHKVLSGGQQCNGRYVRI